MKFFEFNLIHICVINLCRNLRIISIITISRRIGSLFNIVKFEMEYYSRGGGAMG